MRKRRILSLFLAAGLLALQTGCWSSKEIEDLSLYIGLALDAGEPTTVERELEKQGGNYPKRNLITATIQIVPMGNFSSDKQSGGQGRKSEFLNMSETGDSLFEIMRQYSLRLKRAVIGQHLKVIVVSTELVRQQSIDKLMDFVLRDNDTRPSCIVLLSKGKARKTLEMTHSGDPPAFKLRDMLQERFRTGKIMNEVNLTELNERLGTKQSFLLQEVSKYGGETKFTGAGIIKGSTGKWIGTLDQTDVESIAWIQGDVEGGVIKSYDWRNETITYEVEDEKTQITPRIEEGRLSFHVKIESEGRLIENWDLEEDPSKTEFLEKAKKIFEKRLNQMLETTMHKMQSEYKTDVAGFGNRLRITHPKYWKEVESHWDDVFSRTPVTFDIDFTITDYGASKK
ncbi:Ger(x)C family spore germination protein [Paenibacillus sp. MB22_1]|uniref:Ger(x)C family spore germination protein n=1 Tax=unclassified Paenibacillus TaxID=185978 RepID=UPI0021A269E2|nr:Ger(x)C family spore germination protein [Paenibacillus sp. p3-SID1389]MCT2196974.1 Ger(x)C family spore germination protein [Paenibacillus sp. p3-SID1389]